MDTTVNVDFEKLIQDIGPRNPLAYELTKHMDFLTLYRLSRSPNMLIKTFFRENQVWQKRFIQYFGVYEFEKGKKYPNKLWLYIAHYYISTQSRNTSLFGHGFVFNDDTFMSIKTRARDSLFDLFQTQRIGSLTSIPDEVMKLMKRGNQFSQSYRDLPGVLSANVSFDDAIALIYTCLKNGYVYQDHEKNWTFQIRCRMCGEEAIFEDANKPNDYYCSEDCAKLTI